jgi:uncharacterized protein YecE (DUF72 family)
MTLYVGTSGWAYPEWKPEFYPKDVSRARFLEYYGTRLSACEINATFYKSHEADVFKRWADSVPSHFLFAIKAHRALTHGKTIAVDDVRRERLGDFVDTISSFGERRGPVLFQLPAYRKMDVAALESLLEALPRDLRVAFEFRDASWATDEVTDTIVDRGGTICFADTTGRPPAELPPGPFAYVRMRGPRYAPRRRALWRKLLERESMTRDVFVFTKHEGIEAGDPFGGVGLATWFERYARQPARLATRSESESSNHTVVA